MFIAFKNNEVVKDNAGHNVVHSVLNAVIGEVLKSSPFAFQ